MVRKDFSQLGIHGQKRGGYEIPDLIASIGAILGKGGPQNAVIVGCGRIGKALIHYNGFEPDGISIVAGFDTDPLVYSDTTQPVPIYPLSRLEETIKALNVEVAVITVPEPSAADTYEKLVNAGIRGFLNFSPVTLKAQKADSEQPSNLVVHNINIALELEQIFYELQFPNSIR